MVAFMLNNHFSFDFVICPSKYLNVWREPSFKDVFSAKYVEIMALIGLQNLVGLADPHQQRSCLHFEQVKVFNSDF